MAQTLPILVGILLLVLAFYCWLAVFLPWLRGRWIRFPIPVEALSNVGFVLLFGVIGAIATLQESILPRDYNIVLACLGISGWVMVAIGYTLDKQAFEATQSRMR